MDEFDAASVSLLYVDGDPQARNRLSLAIADHDSVSVVTASTGTDAVQYLEGEGTGDEDESRVSVDTDIDCLVSPFELPDTTGLELLRLLRDDDERLPFLLYPTAEHGSERLASEALGAGATSYLPRSLDDGYETLLERVLESVADYRQTERLRLEADMFDTLLSNVPISIYFKDREGRHIRVSDEVGPTMSLDPIGKTDPELYGEEIGAHAQQSYEDDMEVIESGEPIIDKEEVWSIDQPDADTLWLRSTKIPWRDDEGTVRGLVGITRDITELKRREEELELQTQRLDRFASFASHDLRNPLNIAQGYLELAIENGDGSRLGEVQRALEKMDELIDDLLSTAQSDVGLASVGPVPLEAVVEDVWAERMAADATLRTEFPEETVIHADESLLRQLLENLFRNALDHAGARVEITVGVTETGFFVADDGPGIPAGDQDAIFEYGYTNAEGGTGIGLAIVNQVADAHDWSLSVSAALSGGARFNLENCLVVTRPVTIDDSVGDSDGLDTIDAVAGVAGIADDNGTGTSETTDGGGHERSLLELHDHVDIGTTTPPGDARYDETTAEWTVRGGGRNLWHKTDESHVVYTDVDGDARIVGRVASIETVNEYSKAGLMFRGDLEAGSPLGYVGLTPCDESEVLWRADPTDDIVSYQLTNETTAPHWYRIDRLGDEVICYHSGDGEEWIPVDQRTIEYEGTAVLGLAVCSHDPEKTCTAVFDDVRVVDL
ncbi:ATP-binding protein [Halobacteria archaeon AArc-m2/3/4]|uniref:histidine kinase n=1 Tax=Natronoglomus mannanivorans TaxID=2979990 RepID=A0AAP3E205_9EURY|nr:ATP-binding protein [Halobacteria archaeon AArc-xg1-1]MCU4975212.1 ATP-binding protein [Halobacteria archaeon AArc-m2/3/4]